MELAQELVTRAKRDQASQLGVVRPFQPGATEERAVVADDRRRDRVRVSPQRFAAGVGDVACQDVAVAVIDRCPEAPAGRRIARAGSAGPSSAAVPRPPASRQGRSLTRRRRWPVRETVSAGCRPPSGARLVRFGRRKRPSQRSVVMRRAEPRACRGASITRARLQCGHRPGAPGAQACWRCPAYLWAAAAPHRGRSAPVTGRSPRRSRVATIRRS